MYVYSFFAITVPGAQNTLYIKNIILEGIFREISCKYADLYSADRAGNFMLLKLLWNMKYSILMVTILLQTV